MSRCTDGPDEESHAEVGCGFADLCPIWVQILDQGSKKGSSSADFETKIYLFDSAEEFDQHGLAVESSAPRGEVRL